MGGSNTRLPLPNLAGNSFWIFFHQMWALPCVSETAVNRGFWVLTLWIFLTFMVFSFHLWAFGLDPQQSPKKIWSKIWYSGENLWQWQTMKKPKYPCVMGILGEKKKLSKSQGLVTQKSTLGFKSTPSQEKWRDIVGPQGKSQRMLFVSKPSFFKKKSC